MNSTNFDYEALLLKEQETIKQLREYMFSRTDDAVIGEFVIYLGYRMICIAPDSNRGPFWVVESLPCSFTMKHGEKLPIAGWIYGTCSRIYREEQVVRIAILDDSAAALLKQCMNVLGNPIGREIFIHIKDLGRYSITNHEGVNFISPLPIHRQ